MAVAALVALTRLPFLSAGYGSDPDAWRVAATASAIAEHGRYVASRAPGNPLHELSSALLLKGGYPALNGATALFSMVAVAFFALSLRRLRVRDGAFGALALAFTPAVYIHSVDAMDYVWALAFMMGGLYAALAKRAALSGALLGLAVGCRITSGAMLVPFALLLSQGGPASERVRRIAWLSGMTLVVGAATFAPAIATYGSRFLTFYESPGPPNLLYIFKGATVDLWGVPGLIGISVALAFAVAGWSRRRVGATPPPAQPPPREIAAYASGIALYGAAYLRLPHEGAYLIPAVPLVLLWLARVLDRRLFIAVSVTLMVSPFLIKVSELGKADGPALSALGTEFRLFGRPLAVDFAQGPIFWDHARRVRGLRYRDAVLAAARVLPGRSVVVAYEWLPWLRAALEPTDTVAVKYVYLLDDGRVESYRREGFSLYYLPEAHGENLKSYGIDLAGRGGVPLVARVSGSLAR